MMSWYDEVVDVLDYVVLYAVLIAVTVAFVAYWHFSQPTDSLRDRIRIEQMQR